MRKPIHTLTCRCLFLFYNICEDVHERSVYLLSAIPGIGIVENRRNEEEEQNYHRKSIASDIEWRRERSTSVGNLRPIKTDRKQSQTGAHL